MPSLFRLAVLSLALACPARAELPSWDDPAWYAAPPTPLNLTMTPDTGRGVQSTIGPGGGTFSATGASGDVYALTIPAGALFTDTTIAIIPVAQAAGLPEGAGPFSGVILQPDGLDLARTGWLEITPATPIPPEKLALWGFYGMGEDARGEITWPGAGDRIVIPIDHFSGAGVSIADRINLQLDRWRQAALEDRIRSQLAEKIRVARETGEFDGQAFSEEFGKDIARVLQHGWRSIANRPASTCADVKALVDGALGLERQGQLLGIAIQNSVVRDLSDVIDRYWDVCFKQEVQVCLDTGDLATLVRFALSYERQRQLLGFAEDAPDPTFGKRKSDLRAALERCGRFELEVTSQGSWTSDTGDVAGSYAYKVRLPLRLTFDEPNGFSYRIYGEAPATDVKVSPEPMPYVAYIGHRVGAPMAARITTYDFARDNSHRPLRLEMVVSAPEVTAEFKPEEIDIVIPIPFGESSWYLAHRADLSGEAYKLKRFQASQHPVLFEMEWSGTGNDDDAVMSDSTRFRLIHIAR